MTTELYSPSLRFLIFSSYLSTFHHNARGHCFWHICKQPLLLLTPVPWAPAAPFITNYCPPHASEVPNLYPCFSNDISVQSNALHPERPFAIGRDIFLSSALGRGERYHRSQACHRWVFGGGGGEDASRSRQPHLNFDSELVHR